MIVVLLCVFTVPAIGAEMEKGKTMEGTMQEGIMPMMSMMTCAPTGMMGGMMTLMCTPMTGTPMMSMEGTMMTDEMKSMMTTKHNQMMIHGRDDEKQGQMMMEKGKKGMMRK
jgi:hypothetical protein